MAEIYFDYHPRAWQDLVLEELDKKRLAVVVAHRRAGKTEVMVLRLLLAAMHFNRPHPAPLFGYVAPFLNQAKAVAWDRLKFYARNLPGVKISESELSVVLWNHAVIRLFGADYPDRLRGLGFDGVVMDEVAQMRPETWPAVVRPALSDRKGWATFIGTPKGLGLFYELFHKATNHPSWYSGIFSADSTGILEKTELEDLRQEMGDNLFRQEFLCDFSADNPGAFIDFQSVGDAIKRPRLGENPAPLIFGLDVARFGDDRTVLIARRGLEIEKLEVWRHKDLMFTSSVVAESIALENPRAIFVDAVGLGAGVVDRLKQLTNATVIGVQAGARPLRPERFSNLKAEMWHKMREWLMEGGRLPDRTDLKNDLLAPLYSYDHQGRLKIEGKDDLKSRGLSSPDLADALALTFAQPVAVIEEFLPTRAKQKSNLY